MNRTTLRELTVLGLLVSIGVGLRLQLQHIPNFAPVAALALFAGYYFRSRLLAIALPLSVMAISDYWLGGYSTVLMIAVYGMLALPVAMRPFLHRYLSLKESSTRSRLIAGGGLVACGMAASVAFFVVTNLVVWLTTSFYEPTVADLIRCYAQALPFFRYTLAGDVIFSIVLFGGYAVVRHLAATRGRQIALQV